MKTRISGFALAACLMAACGKGGDKAGDGHFVFTDTSTTTKLTWLAYQDGDGAWTTVSPTGGTYSFDIKATRLGVAFVCVNAGQAEGEVVQATTHELSALSTACDLLGEAGGTSVHGALKVPAGAAKADVVIGSAAVVATAMTDDTLTSYQAAVPAGTYDLTAVAYDPHAVPTLGLVQRGVSVTADTTFDLDLVGAGVPLVAQPITVMGLTVGDMPTATVQVTTARGAPMFIYDLPTDAGMLSMHALPSGSLMSGDTAELTVEALAADNMSTRGVVRGFRDPAAVSVTLPNAFSATVTTLAGQAHPRPHLAFTPDPSATFYQLQLSPQSASAAWFFIVTSAWLSGASSYDMPDLSGATGFDVSWFPGGAGLAQAYAVSSTRDFFHTITSDRATSNGAELKYATTVAPYTP